MTNALVLDFALTGRKSEMIVEVTSVKEAIQTIKSLIENGAKLSTIMVNITIKQLRYDNGHDNFWEIRKYVNNVLGFYPFIEIDAL